MKKVRISSSILAVVALLLCAWSLFRLSQEGAEIVSISINLVYFFSLLIAFFCFRISLGYTPTIHPIIAGLAFAIVIIATYTWMYPAKLLPVGKFTLGLIPLLLGTTLMLVVKSGTKWSKILQLLIGSVAVILACCVFLGVNKTMIYTFAFIGLAITSLSLVVHFIFARTN